MTVVSGGRLGKEINLLAYVLPASVAVSFFASYYLSSSILGNRLLSALASLEAACVSEAWGIHHFPTPSLLALLNSPP